MKAAPSVVYELNGVFVLKPEQQVAARASQSGCCFFVFALLLSDLNSSLASHRISSRLTTWLGRVTACNNMMKP